MFCIAALVLCSCRRAEEAPQTASAEQPERLSVSHWTERTELFMEHPVLIAGEGGRFAVPRVLAAG